MVILFLYSVQLYSLFSCCSTNLVILCIYVIIYNYCRQWLPGEKLEKLGVSQELDEAKLIESRKPADRKAVKKAYQEALHYRKQTHNTTLNAGSVS